MNLRTNIVLRYIDTPETRTEVTIVSRYSLDRNIHTAEDISITNIINLMVSLFCSLKRVTSEKPFLSLFFIKYPISVNQFIFITITVNITTNIDRLEILILKIIVWIRKANIVTIVLTIYVSERGIL